MKQPITLDILYEEIIQLKQTILLSLPNNSISPEWISRKDVMKYLDNADTQMAALERSGQIVIAKVGKRKFIHRDSITKLMEKGVQ
jgi:hypothetical protein